MSGRKSKAKGKKGESNATEFLRSNGWYIVDKQTQGLAGDDIFARSPEGKWYSVEVKNTNQWQPKFIGQAKCQAREREGIIKEAIKNGNDVLAYLGCDKFDHRDWLVMWHPSNANASADEWVVAYGGNKGTTHFLAPFKGQV